MIDDKNIIRYLDGEMPEDEKLRFEEEISGSPELAEKVEQFRLFQKLAGKAARKVNDPENGMDGQTRDEIRRAVKDFKEGGEAAAVPDEISETIKSAAGSYADRSGKHPTGPSSAEPVSSRYTNGQIRRIWFSAAAVVLIVAVATILIFRPFGDKPAGDLYAEYFKAFPKSEEVDELSRTDDDLLFAIKMYEAGDYERAAILFEMLADSIGFREISLLYAGNAFMHLNQTGRAIEAFNLLLDHGTGTMVPASRWYLALCYLRKGERALSIEQLELVKQTDSPFRKDARKLLRDLQ
jgi:tetratricopeptide (TPR) repeat protein